MQASYKRMQKQIDAAVQRVEDMAKEEQQEKQQQKDNPPSTPAPKQD